MRKTRRGGEKAGLFQEHLIWLSVDSKSETADRRQKDNLTLRGVDPLNGDNNMPQARMNP